MERLSVILWCLVAGLCVAVAGCAGAEWQKVTVSPSYQVPKQLNVSVVWEAAYEGSTEALDALEAGLADGLASRGIMATFVAAPRGQPETNVTVAEWDPGSQALRYLIGFGAGAGSIVVRVQSPSADGQPGLQGAARGWVRGGFFGGRAEASATQVGQLIAEAIATGQTD